MKNALFHLLAALAFFGVPTHAKARPPATPLDEKSLYQVESAWTDDNGKAFRLTSLLGHPVVIALFFTQCEVSCPIVVEQLKTLRSALPEAVRKTTRFVLVSMDVARDDPKALRGFRDARGLQGEGWVLLRGDDDGVTELAMLLGMKFKQDSRGQFAHSNIVTVLDRQGVIRYQRLGLGADNGPAIAALRDAARLKPPAGK